MPDPEELPEGPDTRTYNFSTSAEEPTPPPKKVSTDGLQLSNCHMKLLTRAIRASLPPIGGQDGAVNPIAHIKFFTPDGAWTWYATEGSPVDGDFMFFGYVIGIVPEWGYFRLSELESIRGHLNLPVERDRFFRPTPIAQFLKPFPEE